MREKWEKASESSYVEIEGNQVVSLEREKGKHFSYRVQSGDFIGIHSQSNRMDDETGFAIAMKQLKEKPRWYPFAPETGKRSRNLTKTLPTDGELLELARECLDGLKRDYPQFIFEGAFGTEREWEHWTNDAGMDFANTDGKVRFGLTFKHRESFDDYDGWFGCDYRTFDKNRFYRMADFFLGSFERVVKLPEELFIALPYCELMSPFHNGLHAESLIKGTSMFSGLIGEKLFSESFTLMDDVSDGACLFTPFWDGEGCVRADDRRIFIENGILLNGYADKRISKQYDVPHTAGAVANYLGLPCAGCQNLRIPGETKTLKELLGGRICVLPILTDGGGFDDRGCYMQPVQFALLYDGERVLGRLPQFTITSNLFDMFGKDFVGTCEEHPFGSDAMVLFRAHRC